MVNRNESPAEFIASRKPGGSKVSSLRFYGDEFVFDTVSGMFFRLTPSASFALRSLDGGTLPADLPTVLQAHYGIDRAAATRDAELFLNELAALEPLDRFTPR